MEFDWNDKARAPGKHQIGVIAQEVQKTFPESVEKLKGNEGYLTVDYASLVAPLIEAVRETWTHVEGLIAKFDRHESEIQALKSEVENLKLQVGEKDERLQKWESYFCAKDPSAPFCTPSKEAH